MLRQRSYLVEETDLKYLLGDRGKIPHIGQEKGRKKKDGISKYVSPFGSYRYVYYLNGEAVSVLQVMAKEGIVVAANVYTVGSVRRKGYASKLFKAAKKDFPFITLNKSRSSDGQAWASQYESIMEDEEQRALRARNIDDERRLPNVHKIIPNSIMKNIPYKGGAKITIYRAISGNDPNRIIRPGDWVSLKKSTVKKVNRGKILQRVVNAYDVVWAGTDETEWFYSPIRGMK